MYPRTLEDGTLVKDDELVGVREHFAIVHRTLFLSGLITGENEAFGLLLGLDSLSHKPIKLVITSPGGDMDSTFLFYDTMRLIKSPVWTFGRICASAAVLILAAGQKRLLSPHARTMLHLPSGYAYGDSRDWEIQHAEMKKYKDKLIDILIECGAKKSHDDILRDIDRDLWLEPEGAIAYGLADKVATQKDVEEWFR